MGTKKINKPKSYIICDQRRIRKNGTAPIRLIVKYDGISKVYGLDIFMTKDDFDLTKRQTIRGHFLPEKINELMSNQKTIKEWTNKAKSIIDKMPFFTLDEFENLMFNEKKSTLFLAFEAKICELNLQGRAGYASSFSCAYNSLKRFLGGVRVRNGRSVKIIGGQDMPLLNITASFLNNYEKWFLAQMRSDVSKFSSTTVGIYLRNLRVLLNDAIDEKTLDADCKPFGKRGYRLPGVKKRKLALRLEEISKIIHAKIPLNSSYERNRDYWLFLYFTGGMNVADMASLKYKAIDDDKISYIRRKTAYKKIENPEFITVPLIPEVICIIDKWGLKPKSSDNYVFNILKSGINPQEERALIVQATKMMNKYIKRLAAENGLETNISTYTARHSFATILKNSGVSVQAISEALGHSDTKVTQNYLADFETSEKRKQWENLLPKM